MSLSLSASCKGVLKPLAAACGAWLLLSSCGIPGTPGAPDPSDPPVGTKITVQDIVGTFPAPKVGINYVYIGVEKKGQVTKTTRAELEVAEIKGAIVKLKLDVAGDQKTVDVDTSKPPILPPGGMSFEGREHVAVPAGTFNAMKLGFSQNSSSINVWAVKGIGVVKTLEQRANGDTMTIQLQSYRQ